MKKTLLTFIIALPATTGTWAQTTFTADNLTYMQIDPTANTVLLTYYETAPTGALDIPATVTHNGRTYTVTSIGDRYAQRPHIHRDKHRRAGICRVLRPHASYHPTQCDTH